MPIIKSAKKALRSSLQKRVYNVRVQSNMRDILKNIAKHIESGKLDEAQKLLSDAYQVIDKAAKRGVIKKNTASRKKSRLAIAIAKVAKK